jgi:hypothetical protein
VNYPIPGQYQVSLIVYNPCGSDTSSVWVNIQSTSISTPTTNTAGWQIRPNPFKEKLMIYGLPESEGNVTISLLDVHGRLMSTETWTYEAGQAIKEIQADHLPQGLILVLIQDESSRVILKAVHQ